MIEPWHVFLALVALILLALFVPITWTLTIKEDGVLRVRGRILGICFYRIPEKARRVRLSDYSPRAMERRQRKTQKKAQKARPSVVPTRPHAQAPISEQLSFAADFTSVILRRSLSLAHIRVTRMAVTVASDDAAKTALLYGAISPALAFLLETLEQSSHLHIAPHAPVGVAADFASDRCRADIHMRFRLFVVQVLIVLFHSMLHTISRQTGQSKRKA